MLVELATKVNFQDDLLRTARRRAHPDPVISPPLYGRWHAHVDRLDCGEPGWVNELNRDPRLRVPAGFGARSIQTGAEGYMARAWAQLGDLPVANQRIRQAQLGLAAAKSLHQPPPRPRLEPHELLATTRSGPAPPAAAPPGVADPPRRCDGRRRQPPRRAATSTATARLAGREAGWPCAMRPAPNAAGAAPRRAQRRHVHGRAAQGGARTVDSRCDDRRTSLHCALAC